MGESYDSVGALTGSGHEGLLKLVRMSRDNWHQSDAQSLCGFLRLLHLKGSCRLGWTVKYPYVPARGERLGEKL